MDSAAFFPGEFVMIKSPHGKWIARIETSIGTSQQYQVTWFLSFEDYHAISKKQIKVNDDNISPTDMVIMSTGPKFIVNQSDILDVVVVLGRSELTCSPIPIHGTSWLFLVKHKYDPSKPRKYSRLTRLPNDQKVGLEGLPQSSKSIILWRTATHIRFALLTSLSSTYRQHTLGQVQRFSNSCWHCFIQRMELEINTKKRKLNSHSTIRTPGTAPFGFKHTSTNVNMLDSKVILSTNQQYAMLSSLIGSDWNFNFTKKTRARSSSMVKREAIRSSSKTINCISPNREDTKVTFHFRSATTEYSGVPSTLRIGATFKKVVVHPANRVPEDYSFDSYESQE